MVNGFGKGGITTILSLSTTQRIEVITLHQEPSLYDRSEGSCNHPVPGPCNECERGLVPCLVNPCTQRNYGNQWEAHLVGRTE